MVPLALFEAGGSRVKGLAVSENEGQPKLRALRVVCRNDDLLAADCE
jgi:hypothetical protein